MPWALIIIMFACYVMHILILPWHIELINQIAKTELYISFTNFILRFDKLLS